jgi:hypothetical protein
MVDYGIITIFCGTAFLKYFRFFKKNDSIIIDSYKITSQFTVEEKLNPVRNGMVKDPKDHLWSSYKVNTYRGDGTTDDIRR